MTAARTEHEVVLAGYAFFDGETLFERLAERQASKPGLRVYAKSTALPRVLGGLGIAIISTSTGLLTDRQCAKKGVGGEVLAYVW